MQQHLKMCNTTSCEQAENQISEIWLYTEDDKEKIFSKGLPEDFLKNFFGHTMQHLGS